MAVRNFGLYRNKLRAILGGEHGKPITYSQAAKLTGVSVDVLKGLFREDRRTGRPNNPQDEERIIDFVEKVEEEARLSQLKNISAVVPPELVEIMQRSRSSKVLEFVDYQGIYPGIRCSRTTGQLREFVLEIRDEDGNARFDLVYPMAFVSGRVGRLRLYVVSGSFADNRRQFILVGRSKFGPEHFLFLFPHISLIDRTVQLEGIEVHAKGTSPRIDVSTIFAQRESSLPAGIIDNKEYLERLRTFRSQALFLNDLRGPDGDPRWDKMQRLVKWELLWPTANTSRSLLEFMINVLAIGVTDMWAGKEHELEHFRITSGEAFGRQQKT